MKDNNLLIIKDLQKVYKSTFGKETIALKDINLEVEQGEFISIIGPSGCGKSTLLKIISNLEKYNGGEIQFSEEVDAVEDIGFVFQDSVLLPWKTVYENVVFPLKIKKMVNEKNKEYLEQLLDIAGLKDFKDSLPRELSGGMKQRASIVRSLSYDPQVLLMDEPFGALDALTRDTLNMQLLEIWEKTKKTILFVTHSIEEAVFLSDRVIVMSPRPGRIKEILDIDIPRPRDLETRNGEKFNEYTKYLREVLE